MLMPSVLPFLRSGRALRRYRTQLQQALAAEPALRLLPGLLSLPLGAAPLPNPEAILAGPVSLALTAPPAGGRSLALLQVVAAGAEHSKAPALYLSLADTDSPGLTPRAIVVQAVQRAGLPASIVEQQRPCVLLLDDFDQLPAGRRPLWRAYVGGLVDSWPAARAVVALPADEGWPELQELRLAAPDDATLADWLARLLPDHDARPIAEALAREPLAGLRNSLCDLLLLGLIFPIAGLPASRTALYEQAYALVRPLLEEEPRPEQLAGGAAPRLLIGRAALRHYRLARGLAGGADLATLTDLSAHERAVVAPLAAGLLDDPRPVLDLLWAAGAPDLAALSGLSAALRERPGVAPAYGLRLVGALAAPGAQPEARALLGGLLPALPRLFAAAEADQAIALLGSLVAAEPAGLAPALLSLIDDATVAPALRWAAADQLVARASSLDTLAAPPEPADVVTLAARCYTIALGRPADRPRLSEPQLRAGLLALFGDDGGEQRRRAAVAALLDDPASPPELRVLALSSTPAGAADHALLGRAVADTNADVRRVALATLAQGDPDAALAAATTVLASPESSPAALADALDTAVELPQPQAALLLGRSALTAHHDLRARLRAVRLLSRRGRAGAAILLRLLGVVALPAPLRAAAASGLGQMGVAAALDELRAALLADGPLLLRRAAAKALGQLAVAPGSRDAVLAGLVAAMKSPPLDTGLTIAVAGALGACGPAAMPALGELLSPAYPARLRAAWLAAVPALADTPAAEWPGLDLPTPVQVALLDALATGETLADQPGGLDELIARQNAASVAAAADALVSMAGARPSLRREAAAMLRQALQVGRPPELLSSLLDRLGELCAGEPGTLDMLLDRAGTNPALRWLALERLGSRPGFADALLGRLQAGDDDPFTRAKIVEVLGAQRVSTALPILRHVAEGRDEALHLRRAAIVALGRLGEPAATAALLRLLVDSYAAGELRGAAAAALPATLDGGACRLLRDQLRAERPPLELSEAVLAALGRAGDQEALALLLRFAQSDRPTEAVAAIEAVRAIGEPSIAPTLVRVTQNAQASPGVRIVAVAALLALCGEEYLPLMRSYLNSDQLPLRLRADAALAALDPTDPRLLTPLADAQAPLALRLTALERLVARHLDDDMLPILLGNTAEEPQLRLRAVAALAGTTRPDAAEHLAGAIDNAPPLLRRRCLEALGAIASREDARADGTSSLAGSRLAAMIAGDGPAEHAHWGGAALLGLVEGY